MLQLHLLGRPEVILDGVLLSAFETSKTEALLYYLAMTGRPHSREVLAELLWGNMPEARARRNLTKALSNLPPALKPYLLLERNSVAFNCRTSFELDVALFQTAVTGSAALRPTDPEAGLAPLRAAVEFYRGDFLEGFFVKNALSFEAWLVGQREHLRRLMLQALDTLVDVYVRPDWPDIGPGLDYASRLLTLDPWRESAHRATMILLARSGQRSAALVQYEQCRRVLLEELEIEPMAETTRLYEQLKVMGPSPPHNLPPQPGVFVGRECELSQLMVHLNDPHCRLITLLGPGGIGKTRLALQAAACCTRPGVGVGEVEFSDGVYIANLTSVANVDPEAAINVSHLADLLTAAIAEAMEFSLYSPAELRRQFLDHLRGKKMLLVLDNFEHLVEAGGFLTDILNRAPGVKLLVTSRERLNLREEWVLEIDGLEYPALGPRKPGPLDEAYSAVALFAQQARQVRGDFTLSEADAPFVVRICQLVEGSPLALELAASWLRVLSCRELAGEIEQNLDFLTSSLRNMPERHRSMRAIFEQSWQMLTGAEQLIFRRLSVFRGGFKREAAQAIAGATLATLAGLVDKSLLRLSPAGRYEIHELLRQFAVEKLALASEDIASIYDQHATYYLDFLGRLQEHMISSRQLEAAAEIEADLENIRAAWEWAVSQGRLEMLYRASPTLSLFHQFRSRYRERADVLERAIAGLDRVAPSEQKEKTLGLLLNELGLLYLRFGQLEAARVVLERSQDIYTCLALPPPRVYGRDPSIGLSMLTSTLGNYTEAARLAQIARQASEHYQHWGNLMISLYILAGAALAQGDHQPAQQYTEQACTLADEMGERWFKAYCLNQLGHIAVALGDYAAAKEHYRSSYALREMFNDLEGMAVALNHMGQLALKQGEPAAARQLYRQSLTIYEEINDRGGLATSLHGLGAAALAEGKDQAAWRYYQQALQTAAAIPFVPLVLSILTSMAEWLGQTGHPARALEMVLFVRDHPAGTHEIKGRAARLLATLAKSGLSPGIEVAARDQLAGLTLETLATDLLEIGQNISYSV